MLNTDQKRLRVECCEQLLKRFKGEWEKFMDRIVTVDETWISLYTPETKAQSTMWKTPGTPSPKKFKMSQSTKKQMFVVCERGDHSPCSSPGTDGGCRILYEGELEYFTCYTRS